MFNLHKGLSLISRTLYITVCIRRVYLSVNVVFRDMCAKGKILFKDNVMSQYMFFKQTYHANHIFEKDSLNVLMKNILGSALWWPNIIFKMLYCHCILDTTKIDLATIHSTLQHNLKRKYIYKKLNIIYYAYMVHTIIKI